MMRPAKKWRVSYELWLNRWLPFVASASTEDAAFSITAHMTKYPGSYRAVHVEHWKNGAWTAADERLVDAATPQQGPIPCASPCPATSSPQPSQQERSS